MRELLIILVSFVLLVGCDQLPVLKTLDVKSMDEIDQVKLELSSENFEYGFKEFSANGETKTIFDMTIGDVKEDYDFESYNIRLIQAFKNSKYDFEKCDEIWISYMENTSKWTLRVFYKLENNGKVKDIYFE